MTRNQIELNKLLESKRSNLANEELTRMRDERSYALGTANLQETRRSNLERERFNRSSLEETSRSNRAREAETYRSNVAREQETYRSNYAREQETYRSNLAKEVETARSNRVTESWRASQLALDTEIRRGELAERRRSNRANEALGWGNISLGQAQLAETRRANMARENLTGTQIANQYYFDSLANAQRRRELDIRQQQTDINAYDAESRRMSAQATVDRVFAQNFRDYATGGTAIANTIFSGFETPSRIFKNTASGMNDLVRSAKGAISIFGGIS